MSSCFRCLCFTINIDSRVREQRLSASQNVIVSHIYVQYFLNDRLTVFTHIITLFFTVCTVLCIFNKDKND